jgi:GntR family transcriptional regulator
MSLPWADHQPIYKQLRARIVGQLLSGLLPEGDALPSIRQLACECQINHLTVSKAYQELVDMQLVEMKRGMGMFVAVGAREKLLRIEQEKFLSLELPRIITRANDLGLSIDELCQAIKKL